MSTKSKSTLLETPKSKPSVVTARPSRVSRVGAAAKSDTSGTPTHLQAPRSSSADKSPGSVTSRPTIDRRSPKLSVTPPDKKATRILKPSSELQAELNVAQEDLKKTKESLASIEKEKVKALDDLKEAQRKEEEACEKLKEALMAQKLAEESSEIEKFRAIEIQQAGIEAARKKEEEWKKEVEVLKSQHANDLSALLSATKELQRVKEELTMTCDAKNQALNHADEATKIAEAHVKKAESLSAEVVRLKSILESSLSAEADEKNELVAELDLEIETLKTELEKSKRVEERLMEREALLEKLNTELQAANKAESCAQNLVKEWKKMVEELEAEAAEAHRLETSASESLETIMKQLEDKNDSLHDAESEIESLKEKAGLLEISISRQRGELEESSRLLKIAKNEAADMAKKVESLISEIETIKDEKFQALNNEKLAADSVQKLLEEKSKLLDELENARDEEEKSKKAMESLASALHEVSSEAREAKERLLSREIEHENYESQIEDLNLVLKATNEKYENMLDHAKQEIDILISAIEKSKLDYQNLKAECEERETDLINSLKTTNEKSSSLEREINRLENLLKETQAEVSFSKDEETHLKNSLRETESEVDYLKEVLGEAKAESMKLKEALMDKENEMQSIMHGNDEFRSREAKYLKINEELTKQLEEALAKKVADEENEELTDSEKDYDVLPKVVEFSEQNGGREENPKIEEISHQSEHFVIKEAENGVGGADETDKESAHGEKDDADSVEADFKMWESCKIEDKDFSPEKGEETESKEAEGSENGDHQNGLSSIENHDDALLLKQQSQKKKKVFLGKFGNMLLKKKSTGNPKQ
ncbi:unnamed protein product [Cuscuta europaea]|uniref:Uncharacterized protein n=1 Tax=Cuscuta europaea TaxID=41803 RepID=A0A9P0ZSI7_CUSEU|nr:unnamed protein product [Cuscuta europaea]